MFALLNVLLNAIITSIISLVRDWYDILVDIAFTVEEQLSPKIGGAVDILYDIGISLIIVKFLKKGFEIYVMQTDGDPDMSPFQLVVNFLRAIVVSVCFMPIYRIFIDILKNVISQIVIHNYIDIDDAIDLGFLRALLLLIALVLFIMLFFKTIGLGINMFILNLGVPLACTGLLDNDKGIFKNYILLYTKSFLTILIQVVLSKLGIYFAITSSGIANILQGDFDFIQVALGIMCMFTALKTPQLLSEFLIPAPPGGGLTSKIYAVQTIKSVVSQFIKK